jgi:hypothetical protein
MATSVWRNRDFWLVLGGGFVNNVGDWLLAVALPAFVPSSCLSGAAVSCFRQPAPCRVVPYRRPPNPHGFIFARPRTHGRVDRRTSRDPGRGGLVLSRR